MGLLTVLSTGFGIDRRGGLSQSRPLVRLFGAANGAVRTIAGPSRTFVRGTKNIWFAMGTVGEAASGTVGASAAAARRSESATGAGLRTSFW